MSTNILRWKTALSLAALFSSGLTGAINAAEMAAFKTDYPAYLSRHEIVYLSPPTEGYEALPLGNGDLGGMIWSTKSGLVVQINKNDTSEQPNDESEMLLRSCGRLTIDQAIPSFDWLYLDDFEARLSLHQAKASFVSTTPFMKFSAQALVQANRNVFILEGEAEGRGDLAENGSLIRISLDRWGSRAFPGWYHGISRPASLGLGKAETGMTGKDVYVRDSLKGLDFVVACRVLGGEAVRTIPNRHSAELTLPPQRVQRFVVLLAAVTSNEAADPLAAATALLDDSEKVGVATLRAQHQQWWSEFWTRSFVHLGDDYLENLYYLQQYLMGSSSRGRYPVMFNAGLWTWNHDVRQWVSPHHWNMQQAYWSVCAANRPELLKPYLDTYWRLVPKAEEYARQRGFTNAILWNEKHDYGGRMLYWQGTSFTNNFTPASQIGQLFWQYYGYTGDKDFLRDRAYPFMMKAAEFYLQYLKWESASQKYYIFPSTPYESDIQLRNTVTDLSMIRTSFRACIEASKILGTDAEKCRQWQNVLDHLADYPLVNQPGVGEVLACGEDQGGKAIIVGGGDGSTFCANLSPVFPAGALGLGEKGTPAFAAAVLRAKSHPENTLAISPIGVVAARLGLADEVVRRLTMSVRQLQHFPQGLFYNLDHWSYLSRYADRVTGTNSFIMTQRDYVFDRAARYKDVNVYGQNTKGEKISTPTRPFVQCGLEPSATLAATVNEMLLQSYEGKIRVFPATPPDWPAAFTLRAMGGFLISSEKTKGELPRHIAITSVLGNECRIVNPWLQTPEVRQIQPESKTMQPVKQSDSIAFPTVSNGVYLIQPVPQEKTAFEVTTFTGERVTKPKTYQEAILGKPRDF